MPTNVAAMWCRRKLRFIWPAGPLGCSGTAPAARATMTQAVGEAARSRARDERAHAVAPLPEVAQDVLDLNSGIALRVAVLRESMRADRSHEHGKKVVFSFELGVERGPAHP